MNVFIIAKLKELKDQCGLTNQQIADKAGLSAATVQRYIAGNAKDAPVESARKIIEAMGGDADEVLGLLSPPKDHSAEIALYERMLDSMSKSHSDQVKEYRKWVRTLAILVGVLVLFIMCLLLIDILNPNVGWFRKALNAWNESSANFTLRYAGMRR